MNSISQYLLKELVSSKLKPIESNLEANIMAKVYDVLHEVVQGQDIILQNYIDSAQNILNSAFSMGVIESQLHSSTMQDIMFDQSSTLEVLSKETLMNAKQSLIFKERLQALPLQTALSLPPMQKLELGKCLLMLDVATEYKTFESMANS